ncbi:putative Nrap protein, expressed [Cocos nucifera]|uniref:Putative Nrap protein, expressed n=1 Tax=Cocos nucifera TaxID=13894 RepID=A0A8K0N0X0_COCNU|nr:putative Nrap protein, expressed [Cocos nucifera]
MGPETDSMNLKVSELLKEVRLDASAIKSLDRAVSLVIDAIRAIPDQEVSSESTPAFIRDLRVPSDKVSFTFRSPEHVQVGGSHSIRSIAKPDVNIDLLIRMPKECFHEKDHLNHRYHAKRFLYLRVVEKSLKSCPVVRKIGWSTFQNEARKPVLFVFPVMEIAEHSEFFIRIIPTATSVFNVSRLNVTRNNVRAFSQGDVTQATPKYNSSIMEDMFLEENAEFVRKVFLEWKSLEEALILLKVTTSSLFEKGLSLQPLGHGNLSKEDMAQYLQLFSVVLGDASGHFNLTFRMTRTAFSALQDEASWTLNCIDKCRDGGFDEIFMTKVDFATKFDYCMRINLQGNARVHASDFCLDDECWRILWECEPWERHLIIKMIIEYILTKHFLLLKEDVVVIVDQLDFCLHLDGKDPISFSGGLIRAFEILAKRLRLLDDIPLRISSVQPLDPAFRHTSVLPPEPHPLAYENDFDRKPPNFTTTCIRPLEVMIQLEGSGNWPLDHVAIEKTKSAFLLKIGESLQDRWGVFCTASEDEVDVLMSGYAFCLRILHDRGLNLSSIQAGNDKVKSALSIDKELFIRSQHSSMINGLHGRFPTYGPVVRLAKRWVSSHLFSSFLAEEAIELVVAYLFLKPFPFHAPCSRITGFLRFLRLLSNYDWIFSPLIVDINDDFTLKDEKEINENFMLSRKSYEDNAQDVEPAMFLATSYDKASEAWTKFSPNRWLETIINVLVRKLVLQAIVFREYYNINDAFKQITADWGTRLTYMNLEKWYAAGIGTAAEPCINTEAYQALVLFRHTSVLPPEPHPLAYENDFDRKPPNFTTTCIRPLEVMIQLEGSGNWPLDHVAIEKTKSAFLLKIGESLQDRWGVFCTASEDEVDVLMSGYAFCLRILHDRGLNLSSIQAGNDKVKSALSIDKELFIRSQHSSMINGLHGRFPTYGPVVRLAKRWVSSHLFSSFLAEEAIELVVAYLFLKPFPFHAPCSRITGFLRFLRLLSNYDWIFSPLIVDINDDFTLKDEKEINENFMLSRKSYEDNAQDVEPAMFLATSYDKASEAWTKFSPNRWLETIINVLVRKLVLQAIVFREYYNINDAFKQITADWGTRLTYMNLEKWYAAGIGTAAEPCINTEAYQALVLFRASKDFHPYMPLGGALKSLEDARNKLMVNFDPVRYLLEDLKREFPDTFNVWCDSLGGDAIGLTWERKDLKKRGRDEADEIRRDPTDILREVGEVGKGFVKSVYLLKAPRFHR